MNKNKSGIEREDDGKQIERKAQVMMDQHLHQPGGKNTSLKDAVRTDGTGYRMVEVVLLTDRSSSVT